MLLKQQRKITFLTERARRDLFDFAAGNYAAKNAKSLNVSVEYLVTGSNQETQNKDVHYSLQIRQIIKKLEQMNEKQLHMIQEIITAIEKEMP